MAKKKAEEEIVDEEIVETVEAEETEEETDPSNVVAIANFKDKNTKVSFTKGQKFFVKSKERIAELVKAKVAEEL